MAEFGHVFPPRTTSGKQLCISGHSQQLVNLPRASIGQVKGWLGIRLQHAFHYFRNSVFIDSMLLTIG